MKKPRSHRRRPGCLRKIFEPKREEKEEEELAGGWRELYEELRNLYSPSNIVTVVKPKKIRWAEHVAHIGAM
jgi:hypothetical protein